MSANNSAKQSIALSFFTFISRILGLVRDHFMAVNFGNGIVASAFSVAYRLPNMFRNFLAEGTLSQSFMPIFVEEEKQGKDPARIMTGAVLSFLTLVLFILFILMILFSNYFLGYFLGNNQEFNKLTIELTFILFFLVIISSLSSLFISIANSKNKYFVPSLSPIILNLFYIITFLCFFPFFSDQILKVKFLSFAIVTGGLTQFILQIFYIQKLGFSPKINFNWKHPAIKKIFKLMLPALVGGGFYQFSLLVDIFIANYIQNFLGQKGVIVALDYSQRLVQLPTGMIGVALSTTILPSLLINIKNNKKNEMSEELTNTICFGLYITIPAMIGMCLLSEEIINSIYLGGHWDLEATRITMIPLMIYSLATPVYSLNKILISSFYAFKDTKTPLRIQSFSFLLNIFFNILLMFFIGYACIPVSSVFTSSLTMFFLTKKIKKNIPEFEIKKIFFQLFKMIPSFLFIILWVLIFQQLMNPNLIHLFLKWNLNLITQARISLTICISGTILIYFLASIVFNIEESKILINRFRRKS